MEKAKLHFSPPGLVARTANRFYGWLTALGLGPSYSYLLITTGRKTGRSYSTPVNVLNFEGKLYLVGTRGHTQWSRNAVVSGTVTLKRARRSMEFRLRDVPDDEKPKILKAYLSRFNWMVSRFFPLAADSPVSSFGAIATRYPVFELLPSARTSDTAAF
jgi:deazaflavin-dependent oxidoreductase (nitroreductase family)